MIILYHKLKTLTEISTRSATSARQQNPTLKKLCSCLVSYFTIFVVILSHKLARLTQTSTRIASRSRDTNLTLKKLCSCFVSSFTFFFTVSALYMKHSESPPSKKLTPPKNSFSFVPPSKCLTIKK